MKLTFLCSDRKPPSVRSITISRLIERYVDPFKAAGRRHLKITCKFVNDYFVGLRVIRIWNRSLNSFDLKINHILVVVVVGWVGSGRWGELSLCNFKSWF